jgi:predicted Zn finger-like uncharacterized protein
MKLTCPKCHAAYRVDLPDSSEDGIDVQCGQCLHIFLFSPEVGKPEPSAKSRDSDLPEDRTSEPILPPQKDEDQEVSGSHKQAPSLSGKGPETTEELELESLSDYPEPIEIVIESDIPDDSLEAESLDDLWDQALEEGAQTTAKSKEKSPTQPPQQPVVEAADEKKLEATPPPSEKKTSPLPSLEDRQQEVDQIVQDHHEKQGKPEDIPSVEESQPPLVQKNPHQEKTQEGIDLEEQVTINEEEAIPSQDEALTQQSEVDAVWSKTEQQDQIQEEQQLAEALEEKDLPTKSTSAPQENEQSHANEIFAEAKPQQEKTQEEIDLNEEVVIREDEAMPSWEEAFAHQAEVETGWKKAKERDRLQEEQQLAEALSETQTSAEPADSKTPTVEENPQEIVDDIFAQMKKQDESADQPAQETPVFSTADSGTPAEEEEDEPTWSDAFADQSETETTWKKPEEQEGPSEVTVASEEEETTVLDPAIADELVNMDMKQLVEEAFKEESEQTSELPVSEEAKTPAPEEAAPEPELTLEMETSPETPADEQTVPASQDEENIDQTLDPPTTLEEDTWTEAFADPLAIEDTETNFQEAEEEPAPEPVTTSAQEELEIELEPNPESTGIQAETETTITDPLEMELEPIMESREATAFPEEPMEMEPEPIMESYEAPAPSEEQPATSQEPSLDKEGEELWADLLPEHKEEEQFAQEEAPATAFSDDEEDDDGASGGSDFWDQVLEKDSQESQTAQTESKPEPVSSAPTTEEPAAQGTVSREALTDEELWQQAFPEEKQLEPSASKHFDEEEGSPPSFPPLVIGADVNLNEESEGSPKLDEAAYADYDDDDDEFEFQRKKRSLGPFTIPHGRRGDLVIGGAMVVFLLLAGSVYFTLQTFAPGELTNIQTAETEIPEGLSPREVPLDELAGDLTTPKPQIPDKTPQVDTPGDKGEAILSDPAKILEESPEEKGILKDLAESEILKDTGETQTAKVDESALQPLIGHSVTMSTIMPVAYNPTDIRVLSFSVEIQLSNAQSAKMVRESMPVYEEIMNRAVEDLLRRKFYNDILYVKEKLQKRLQTAMNKSLKNGRVRKAKFVDFAIQ